MSPGKYGHAPIREAVFWSDKMNEYLIDLLLHQKAIGNWGEGRFFPVAYDNIINGIRDRFGMEIDRINIRNRLKSIKETLNECTNLFCEDSRIKWSVMSKRFHADPHVWSELIERKPEAKKWMTKTIDHYDRLMELFGKDMEKRPAVENAKSTSKKKVRKESPKKHQLIPNGLDFTVANSSDTTVNRNEIPAKGHRIQRDCVAAYISPQLIGTQQLRLPEPEPVVTDPAGSCKARNNLCYLEREGFIESSQAQACDICCTEPGFCRQCCCILCRKTIDYYSFCVQLHKM